MARRVVGTSKKCLQWTKWLVSNEGKGEKSHKLDLVYKYEQYP